MSLPGDRRDVDGEMLVVCVAVAVAGKECVKHAHSTDCWWLRLATHDCRWHFSWNSSSHSSTEGVTQHKDSAVAGCRMWSVTLISGQVADVAATASVTAAKNNDLIFNHIQHFWHCHAPPRQLPFVSHKTTFLKFSTKSIDFRQK